jgi:hypothetical protein
MRPCDPLCLETRFGQAHRPEAPGQCLATASGRPVGAARFDGRSRRVALLILAIVILSVADLVVTLAYARSGGMMEANPIALYLAKVTRSMWALAGYKFLTVGMCTAVLYRLRQYPISEVAAWAAVLILTAMSFMWHTYSKQVDTTAEMCLARGGTQNDHWLVFD